MAQLDSYSTVVRGRGWKRGNDFSPAVVQEDLSPSVL